MATITPTKTAYQPNHQLTWTAITEADTPAAETSKSGRYTFTVEGTFGGGSIELQYSHGGAAYHSIDSTNLKFTADGSYNIEIGSGWFKPVRTGGTSMNVNAFLTPIP